MEPTQCPLEWSRGCKRGKGLRVCVSALGLIWAMLSQKKKFCSNLWCLHNATYRHGYVPTPPLLPLPRTHFRGSSSMEHARGQAAAQGAAEQREQSPWNSACCLLTSIPRGARQQMAETNHRERQLKQHWKGAGMECLGLLSLEGRGLKGGIGVMCLICFNLTKSPLPY